MVSDGAERKYIGPGSAFVPARCCFGRQIKLRGVREVILNMKRAGGHGCAGARSFAAACHLPISDLKARGVALRVAHKDALRRQASMVEALAMSISHRLAKLTDKGQALVESEAREPLAEVTVEAGSFGIVLKDKSRAELRLAIIEDTLDASMLDPLQNTKFPLRGARETIARLWRRGSCIRINSDAPADAGGCVAGSEVLPVFSFPE